MKLREIAKVIRSKNAGPFEITFDILFESKSLYDAIKKTGIINKKLFADLYNKEIDKIIFVEYDPGYAFKATISRDISSGEPGDNDVYGAQQSAPLLDVEIPLN